MKKILFIYLFIPLLTISCKQTPISSTENEQRPSLVATAAVDKAITTTNDEITYSITFNYKKDIAFTPPEIGSELADFRVIDFGEEKKETERDRVTLRKWYRLKAEISGSYILPPVEIAYQDEKGKQQIKTSQIFIEVKSFVDENAKDIRDIKMQEEIPFNYKLLIIISSIVIVAIAGVVVSILLYRRYKRKKREEIVALPHTVAYRELNELIKQNLIKDGKYKEHYFILSEILRKYFEMRFSIPAQDRTSEELLPLVASSDLIMDEVKSIFRRFLNDSDIVKFAKYIPSQGEVEKIMERSFLMIDKTKEEQFSSGRESEEMG